MWLKVESVKLLKETEKNKCECGFKLSYSLVADGKWELLVYADISTERMDPISHTPCFPHHRRSARIHVFGGSPWFSGTSLTTFPRLLLPLVTHSDRSESTFSEEGKH